MNFQFSLKYPLWKITDKNTLNIAYTQKSFWQAYQSNAFFSETNYTPEIFLANEVNWPIGSTVKAQFLNAGLVHQSNGEGGALERSWNRAYAEGIFTTQNWTLSVEPWYVFQDNTYTTQNPDMAHYMGYGQTTLSYQRNEQEWSLMARTRALQATWSFPLCAA